MADKEQSSGLVRRVLHFIRKNDLISDPLVVAVSGGADSVCLLHILARLKDELGVRLHVAHLDHGLRGSDAEADARYVAGLSQSMNIPATIEKRDVAAYQAEKRISLEEAGREVRYAFLAEVARSVRAKCAALGHTSDDNIETVLMHIIRGTGVRGLTGLKPRVTLNFSGKSLTVERPLLSVSREETQDYCSHYKLSPRLDASNLSLSLLRNSIRLELLPKLKEYNPRIAEVLLRMAGIAADDIDYLEKECARLCEGIVKEKAGLIVFDKRRFQKLHRALKRNLLRSCMEKLLGDIKDIEERHIDEIMSALAKPAGKRIDLPRGVNFVIEYDSYLLTTNDKVLSPLPDLEVEFTIAIPGETVLPGWKIEAAVIEPGRLAAEDKYTACFDFDRTGDRLIVRNRRTADRFQPQGMSGEKKVGRFMIDARVPRDRRAHVPIVCSPEHIVWVVGWRIDDRVKVTSRTKRALRLRFDRVAN